MAAFLNHLNAAVPGLGLGRGDVVRVYAGMLPARREGDSEPADREAIHDHGQSGGPKGMYTVIGIKFTTARAVAAATLGKIAADGRGAPAGMTSCPRPAPALAAGELALPAGTHPAALGLPSESLRALVEREAVVYPDDLLLRRMDSTESFLDRARAEEVADRLFGESRVGPGPGRTVESEPRRD